MYEYLQLAQHILNHGEEKSDRTGTGTLSVFGYQMRIDLRNGFPLLTTKKIVFKSVLKELLWFLAGKTNINDGLMPDCKIWNPWADGQGNLGPIYGYQWRKWEKFVPENGSYRIEHIDQIQFIIDMIKNNPDSRRIIVNAWNVADIDKMALPPCHTFFQFYVSGQCLDCQLYQRSADVAIGVPFNIASYSLLLLLIAKECGLTPRYFVHTLGDAHIYLNHLDGIKEQLVRTPGALPELRVADKPLFDLQFDDVVLLNYQPQKFITFPIAV